MADLPGNLSFASYVRQGLAGAIGRVDGAGSGTETTASVTVNFQTEAGPLSANAQLALVGPGDIVGLDARVVVRVWPPASEQEAESGSLALIELDQADLPWRYTPARSNAAGQLRPWLNLVVLEEREGTLVLASSEMPRTVLQTDKSVLPNLNESWAWAHTQFVDRGLSPELVGAQIRGRPGQFTSRLIAPRALARSSRYLACLVPTFERGRLAGLGQSPGDHDALTLSWNFGERGPISLPVYYFWRFQTGEAGGFRELARLIRPTPLPAGIGRRALDVQSPGMSLPAAASSPLAVEGALQSLEAASAGPSSWPATERARWSAALQDLLREPELESNGRPVKVVSPPLYGRWHARVDALNAPLPVGTNPPWFFELNTDPRSRVAAGLGTTVIQRNQQALLASGWKQVGDALAINQRLKIAQLGREVAKRVFDRHIAPGTSDTFWTLTGRLHAFAGCGGASMCERFDASPVPPWIFDPFWRRLARPRGAIGVFQGRPKLSPGASSGVIDRMNEGQRPAPEPPTPPGMFTPGSTSTQICFDGLLPDDRVKLAALDPQLLLLWALVLIYVGRELIVSERGACYWHALRLMRFGIALFHIAKSAAGAVPGDADRRIRWCTGNLSAEDIAAAPPSSTFTPSMLLPIDIGPLPVPGAPGGADNADAAAFRLALIRALESMRPKIVLQVPPPFPNLNECRGEYSAALSPELTVVKRVRSRIAVHPSVAFKPRDPLEPIFAPPNYERPMYGPLSELSQDWIMPGIDLVERNSAGIALTNQRFIEAYMVGLNQEMTRELLWNELPVDQRGTYFRQFWDVAGLVPPEGSSIDPETLRDVLPLAQWAPTTTLGQNRPGMVEVGREQTVLVIRAQLIQRYPNAIVYALRGEIRDGKAVLSSTEKHPLFSARVAPDIALFGFDLPVAEARSLPGWFFVLAEQPGEPKFFVNGAAPGFVSPPVGRPTAGQVATALFVNPFRVALHGSVLLPPT